MSVSQAKNNLQAQLDSRALAEMIRISEQAREEYEAALKAYDEAIARRNVEAVVLADWALAGTSPDAEELERYKKARNGVDFVRMALNQKYTRYSDISDHLLREMQKPPAGATAEGYETKIQNGK